MFHEIGTLADLRVLVQNGGLISCAHKTDFHVTQFEFFDGSL